jgi:hypothetical protein
MPQPEEPAMRPSAPLPLTALFAVALAVAACGKSSDESAAASAPAASSSAPVQWDFASTDPAKNPNAANKEGSAPGYIP